MNTSDKAMYDEIKILLNHLQVIQYIRERNFVFALRLVRDFSEENKNETSLIFKRFTYFQQGLINTAMGNGKEAIVNYTKSLEYQHLYNLDRNLIETVISYYGIIDAYLSLKDYDSGIPLCNSIIQDYMEEGSRLRQIANLSIVSGEKKFKRLSILFKVNRYYAYSYISKNELKKARLYLDKCEEEFPYLDQTNMPLHYELKAFYYWKLKEYDLAYKNINKAIEEVGSVALTSKELNYFVMKADILKEWGEER